MVGIVSVLFVLMLLASCAKAPLQDVDAAKAALQSAKDAEAERYVSGQYMDAKDSLDVALAEVEKQNAKFAWFRKYDDAKSMLQTAISNANAAKNAAVAEKDKVRKEAEDTLLQAQAAVASGRDLLTRAPKGKGERAAVEAIKADLDAVETSFAEVSNAITQGELMSARDKARASLDKANSLNDELKIAIEKTTKK
jgi:16S rRNA G1207 methylase RsmC